MNYFRNSLVQFMVVLSLLVFMLAGCGSRGENTPAVDLQPAELVYITDFNQSQTERELLRKFEELNPGITFSTSVYSDWTIRYMRADTPPDLMTLWSGSWLLEGVRENLLTDLTEINAQIELDTLYEEQLQNQIERGGRHFFVPVGYHWRGIYYNVEVFNQLGLETPQTWEELLEVADTLQNNGIIPFAIPRQDEWTASIWFDYLNMRLNGAEFHRALISGEVSYTDERVHNVFLTWQSLFDLDYFTTDVSVSDGFLSAAAIIRGDGDTPLTYEKAAMSLLAPFDFEDLPQVFQDELSVFPFPQINSTIPQGETLTAIGYGVPSGALNRIQAMAFVNFMTTADAQANIVQGMSGEAQFIPVDTADREQLPRSVRQGLEIAEQAEAVVLPLLWAGPDSMDNAIASEIGRFLRNASKEPANIDDLLTSLEEARGKALQQGEYTE